MAEPTPNDRPINARMSQAEREIEAMRAVLAGHTDTLNTHRLILNGNEQIEILGLVKRVITLEKLAETGADERKRIEATARGMLIGLTITSIASGGSLIAVLVQLVTGAVNT